MGRSLQPVGVHGAGTVTMDDAKNYAVLGNVTAAGEGASWGLSSMEREETPSCGMRPD